MAIYRRRTCRECGTPISDKISLMYGVGSGCRREMSGELLAAALKLTRAEAAPGYVPQERPASPQAAQTNAAARAVVARAAAPASSRCEHDGLAGQCPLCRRDNDPHHAAARIIEAVLDERRRARNAANTPPPIRSRADASHSGP